MAVFLLHHILLNHILLNLLNKHVLLVMTPIHKQTLGNLITPNVTDNIPDQLQALLYYIYLTSAYLAVPVRSVTPLCITTLPYQQQFSQPTPGTVDAQLQQQQQQQQQPGQPPQQQQQGQRPPSLPPYSSARQQQLAQHFNLFLAELSASLQPPMNPTSQ
eukprot:UN10121